MWYVRDIKHTLNTALNQGNKTEKKKSGRGPGG